MIINFGLGWFNFQNELHPNTVYTQRRGILKILGSPLPPQLVSLGVSAAVAYGLSAKSESSYYIYLCGDMGYARFWRFSNFLKFQILSSHSGPHNNNQQ